jgi:Ca-activated chloride channel family protein
MPLTVDHGAAAMYISSAGPDAVPQQGTVISDALSMSARAFDNTDRRFKAVILISDGEDHDEEAISTAKELSQQGVMINTIGIGSAEGSEIIDPATGVAKTDPATGATVISKLNEDELKQIAEKTNGIYIHLQNTDEALNSLQKQLSQIERKAFGDVSLMSFKTYYLWLAAAMFVLLLAENFIPERKKEAA